MTLNSLSKEIYEANKAKGFWDTERNFGELLMLVTSELGEALEAHRHGCFARKDAFKEALSSQMNSPIYTDDVGIVNKLFKEYIKDSVEDEIADAIIRLFDLAGGLGIDLDFHVNGKLAFNASRPIRHGKAY